MRSCFRIEGSLDQKSVSKLEYDVEDLRGVNRCKVDSKDSTTIVEYDEFLVSVPDLLRAIQGGGRFKVVGIN